MDLKIDYIEVEDKNLDLFSEDKTIKNIFINMYGKENLFPEDAKFFTGLAEKYKKSKIYFLNVVEDITEGLQFVLNANKNMKVLEK